jgi:hypothetical protein
MGYMRATIPSRFAMADEQLLQIQAAHIAYVRALTEVALASTMTGVTEGVCELLQGITADLMATVEECSLIDTPQKRTTFLNIINLAK